MSNTPRRSLASRRKSPKRLVPIVVRLAALVVVLLVIVAATDTVNKVQLSHAGSAIPELRSGIAGYCLDDHHDIIGQNVEVESAQCDGRPSEDWTLINTSIMHSQYCLSVENNGIAQGDDLVTDRCDGAAGQVWVSAIGGYQNPSSGMCLAIPRSHTGQQLVIASCKNLTEPNVIWAVTTWSSKNEHTGATVSCNSGTEGEQVACYAAKQWVAWQSGSPSHETLLNEYSDGNAYEEWCADFVSYVYKEAGYPFTDGERNGWDEYVADNVQYENFTYHAAGSGYIPQAGDVAYFDYPGGHVEIVAVGGSKPLFIYGDSGTTDPSTHNGEMTENALTNDPSEGQLVYYLSPA